ncbi:MAG: adenylyltransferase/cytidyltransferase family protein [Nanoarchaeota archaeon]|nr:adenylyltransferase/cytidyltransferase family protein [Nanoarchaeota archaeon]
MVFGTFDIIHPGHLYFLKEAKKHGDFLVAVIGRDLVVKKIKGLMPVNSENTRLDNIKKVPAVDKVVLGDLTDYYRIIKEEKPDIICLGYDQKEFIDGLKDKIEEFGLKTGIIRLKPYKENVYKSSKLK